MVLNCGTNAMINCKVKLLYLKGFLFGNYQTNIALVLKKSAVAAGKTYSLHTDFLCNMHCLYNI